MKTTRPRFLLHGLLIVLPVVLLTGLGLLAVFRDYALAEQEARERATLAAVELPERLGRIVLEELQKGSALDTEPLPGPVFLGPQGDFRQPVEVLPPKPANWRSELSAGQTQLWLEISGGAGAPGNAAALEETVAAFTEENSIQAARTNAEFLLLLARLQTLPPTGRMDALIRFATEHRDVESESGLPLSTVALARALQEAAGPGITAAFVEALTIECERAPSVLTPRLLEAAAGMLSGREPGLHRLIASLQEEWRGRERLLELGRLAWSRFAGDNVFATNLWLQSRTGRWLTSVQPHPQPGSEATKGSEPNHAEPGWRLDFVPKRALQDALHQGWSMVRTPLPSYLGLRAWIEGEPLLPSETTQRDAPPATLARMETILRIPVDYAERTRPTSRPVNVSGEEGRPTSLTTRLTCELVLADSSALYARARQRATLLAGFVLVACGAAVAGLVFARRAFQHQLRLNDMKSSFVSSVSHELRAPIASVRLLAESLDRGTIGEEGRRRDYYRLIVQECRRLSALIENALDFSRIDQGRKRYEPEPTDLVALAAHTVEVMEPYAAERGVRLDFDHASYPAGASPHLDGRAIQQALVNLLDNAVKHSPPGGVVSVILERVEGCGPPRSQLGGATRALSAAGSGVPALPGKNAGNGVPALPVEGAAASWIRLSIGDEGPGIPTEERERIFEPFYRRGSELRRETQGVGIGLTIVRHVVEAHGGRIRVESGPGSGSRFVIELPDLEENPSGSQT